MIFWLDQKNCIFLYIYIFTALSQNSEPFNVKYWRMNFDPKYQAVLSIL